MPVARNPLLAFRATGILGSHRQGKHRRAFKQATLEILPTIDTYLDGILPNNNFGANVWLKTGITYSEEEKSGWFRSLHNYDLSPLSGKVLLSAHLLVLLVSHTGAPLDVYLSRNTRPDTWTENGATWNSYDGVNPWTAGGGDFDDVTPPKVTYEVPAAGGWQVVPDLLAHAVDAVANRSGVCALHTRAASEAPEVTQNWWVYSSQVPINSLRLVVEYVA